MGLQRNDLIKSKKQERLIFLKNQIIRRCRFGNVMSQRIIQLIINKLWTQIAVRKYEKERARKMIHSTFLLQIVINRYLKRFAGRTNLNKLRFGLSSASCLIGMSRTQERKCKSIIKRFLTESSYLYALSQSFKIYQNKIYFISRRIKLRAWNR